MMLVVAALLTPREYGFIALSVFVMIAAQITCEFGIWQAVVRRSDPDERFLSTAFTANIVGALILTAGLFLAAPWIAHFYAAGAEMSLLLQVMALGLIFDGIYSVPDGLLRKELNFRGRALPEISGAFGAAIVTILLLYLEIGVLSFGAGHLAQSMIRCGLTLYQVNWRPKLGLSWTYLREIASYGKSIFGGELIRYASANIDYLIVGRVLGTGPLGFYSLAYTLANYPVTNFVYILSRIAFPTFAALQEDFALARRAYLKMIRIIAAVVAPMLVVLALVASPLVIGLLGEKWQPAILPLQLLVIGGITRSIAHPGSDVLRALGYPGVVFRIDVLQAAMVAGGLIVLASWGIEVVALTMTVILGLSSSMITATACRRLKVGPRELGRTLLPGGALSVSGALPILVLSSVNLASVPDIVEAGMLLTAAGAGMAFCAVTVCKDFLREIIALMVSAKPNS